MRIAMQVCLGKFSLLLFTFKVKEAMRNWVGLNGEGHGFKLLEDMVNCRLSMNLRVAPLAMK